MSRLRAALAALVVGAAAVVPAAQLPRVAAAASTGSAYTAVVPVRVLDTRAGVGTPTAPVRAGTSVVLDLSARVPESATAVVLNVTGTDTTAPTFVTVWPDGVPRPTASNLNLVAGETRPNLVTVAVGAGRKVRLHNHNGSVNLIADLAGHYSTGAGSRYTPFPPQRVLDSRDGTGMKDAANPDGSTSLDLTEKIPAKATAVTFNLTATNVTAATFVTAWPHGSPRPTTSNLNVVAGETRPNLVTVAVGADRKVDLANRYGTADLIADLAGFYSPSAGVHFFPVTPARVLDTRGQAAPAWNAPTTLRFTGLAPANASAYVLNLTATDATAPTFVSAVPATFDHRGVSNLNVRPGQVAPNLAAVVAGPGGDLLVGPGGGQVHVIADLAGYFAPAATTCATGCVHAWGRGDSGFLGSGGGVARGAGTASPTPTAVSGLDGVTAVADRYALRANGTVWAWGDNTHGQLGQGWSLPGGYAPVPVPVAGLTGVVAIAASRTNGYALCTDGTVWAWGDNTHGQLGAGIKLDVSPDPVQVYDLADATAIAAADGTAYALRADGTVWAWGSNADGALGDGSGDPWTLSPVQVGGLTEITALTADGANRYALRADGTVWAWGPNTQGQLGQGALSPGSTTPVQVPGLTGLTAVAAGTATGYALRPDRTVWTWGANTHGQAGTDTAGAPITTPRQIPTLAGVTTLTAGGLSAAALDSTGALHTWGNNNHGQLGDGTTTTATAPKRISAPTPAAPTAVDLTPTNLYTLTP